LFLERVVESGCRRAGDVQDAADVLILAGRPAGDLATGAAYRDDRQLA
jgi:hypothetical protein